MTPSQTIGPFFHHALVWPDGAYVVPAGHDSAIWIRGRVLDGAGAPVTDALVESWQLGEHSEAGMRGYGRVPTDEAGWWALHTVKPATVNGHAPHLALSVFARGLLNRVVTRLYFADEQAANAADPVLSGVDPQRVSTLLAQPCEDGYSLDIHLQGPDETVFFAL